MAHDPIHGMFGLDLGDEQSLDLSQALPGAEQTTSLAQRETIREARKLLGECLSEDTVDPDSPELMSRMSSTLDDIMIEKDDGDIGRHVRNFYSTSGHDIPFQLLRYIVYLSTNNLLADNKLDKIVLWLIKNGKFWALTYLVDIKSPTTEILASNVFLSAARIQSEVAIRTLLASGINPNVIAGFNAKRTALHVAVVERNISLVRLLLDAGADPNVNYKIDGMAQSTALAASLVWPPPHNFAELLIKHGADVNTVSCTGEAPLNLAVQTQNVDLVRALLSAGARVNFVTATGTTALQLAAYWGTPEIVEALVSAEADVDCPNEKRCKGVGRRAEKEQDYGFFIPPLQRATERDNVEMVQILLEAGANVNGFPGGKYFSRWLNRTQADNGGGVDNADIESDTSTDSDSSYEDNFWDYCGEKYGVSHLGTALQEAVLNNNMVLARLFLSLGANVDAMVSQGTALQIASRDPAKIKLVKLLLRKGADVNSVSQKWHSTALVGAAKSGDEGLVETLLDANADPNAPTYDDETPLHAAVGSGKVDLVRLLINAGAHVNIRPAPNGHPTPLQAAVKSGNIGLVRLLINAGGDVNTRPVSREGRTCLQIACEEGVTQMFNYLLQLGADVNDSTSRVYGYTALQAATEYLFLDHEREKERVYMVRKLLENGADPNTPGPTCPLSEAISKKQYELAQVLLDKGADPNGQRYCREPLQWAVERESVDMARHLLTLGADANRCFEGKMPLLIGARHGNLELVKLLVDAGGAKITGMDGTRALINAVKANSIDSVRFFFERGVCPNLPRGLEEKSAVLIAVELRPINLDMLKLLVSNGADVGKGHGGDPLQLASAKGALSTVQILLGAGADVNCPGIGDSGRTALQKAVRVKNMGMVRLLLHAGADINAPPSQKWGMTALQQAIDANNLGMVRFLLSRGASVNGPCSQHHGATALQRAAIRGNLRIALMLLKLGADVNAPAAPVGGRTALEAAAEHGRLDLVYLLLRNDGDMESVEQRCKRAAKLASSAGHVTLAKILREWQKPSGETVLYR